MRVIASLLAFFLAGSFAPAKAQPAATLVPPVDGPVVQVFEPPSSRFGPGHRGIDYSVPEGSPVRAAGSGTVVFAGSVAGREVVTLDHGEGLRTTYSILSRVDVAEGEPVRAGQVIGTTGSVHPGGRPGLHFGVMQEGQYVDPEAHLVIVDPAGAIRLAPVEETPLSVIGIDVSLPTDIPRTRECTRRYDLDIASEPPNDNVAVAIAGINSSSDHADLFEAPPELLGYRPGDVYRFSYRGPRGPRFHEDYDARDTWQDIRRSATHLADMLREIKGLHPGKGVDLIAHSQGGVVARTYLELIADPGDDSLPQVEHLVTFATPHQGAPLALEAVQLRDSLGYTHLTGKALSELGKRTGAIPDVFSTAVAQIAEGSELITDLAVPDSGFGTRYLSLAAPADLIVPATRTQVEGAVERTARFDWTLNAHSSIVTSEQARGMAHSFLRDAPDPCLGSSETWGSLFGSAISAGESVVAESVGVGTSLLPGALWAASAHAAARVARDPNALGATAFQLGSAAFPTARAFQKVKAVVRSLRRR